MSSDDRDDGSSTFLDDTTSPGERRGHFQPRPPVALGLLVAFVVSLVIFAHDVAPVSVGGQTVTTASVVTPTTVPVQHVPKSQVRVQVANGTSTSGLAKMYSEALQTLTWNVLAPINGNIVPATEVWYRPGFAWAAEEIAPVVNTTAAATREVGPTPPLPGTASDDVIVILGPDAIKN